MWFYSWSLGLTQLWKGLSATQSSHEFLLISEPVEEVVISCLESGTDASNTDNKHITGTCVPSDKNPDITGIAGQSGSLLVTSKTHSETTGHTSSTSPQSESFKKCH